MGENCLFQQIIITKVNIYSVPFYLSTSSPFDLLERRAERLSCKNRAEQILNVRFLSSNLALRMSVKCMMHKMFMIIHCILHKTFQLFPSSWMRENFHFRKCFQKKKIELWRRKIIFANAIFCKVARNLLQVLENPHIRTFFWKMSKRFVSA